MRDMLGILDNFLNKASSLFSLPSFSFTITDFIEILLIAVLFYNIMLWVKNTRAWTLFKGIAVILALVMLATIFQMNTILWIAQNTINIALIALVIIFQPELRKALESLGDRNFFVRLFGLKSTDTFNISNETIDELVRACFDMGRVRTGALIVIEQSIILDDVINTGIRIDGIVTSQLLINIFEKNTPLHDGAVVIKGDRIASATCYLPLSDNKSLSKEMGTRHRAAVGVSEVSDSFTIVVSEETGRVSVAYKGMVKQGVDQEYLREHLKSLQIRSHEENSFEKLKRRFMNVSKDS